jgi:hypothetical protein
MPTEEQIIKAISDALWPPPDWEPAFWGDELKAAAQAVRKLFETK